MLFLVGCVTPLAPAQDSKDDIDCPAGMHDNGEGECTSEETCADGFTLNESGECTMEEVSGDITRISVRNELGLAVSGAFVVFHDETGEILALETSDSTGQATTDEPEVGMVTVASEQLRTWNTGRELMLRQLRTHLLRPGDELVVEVPSSQNSDQVVGTLRVRLPGAHPDGFYYHIDAGIHVSPAEPDADQSIEISVTEADLLKSPLVTVVAWVRDTQGEYVANAVLADVDVSSLQAAGLQTLEVEVPDWEATETQRYTLEPGEEGESGHAYASSKFFFNGRAYGALGGGSGKYDEGISAVVSRIDGAELFEAGIFLSKTVDNANQEFTIREPHPELTGPVEYQPDDFLKHVTGFQAEAAEAARPTVSWDPHPTADALEVQMLAIEEWSSAIETSTTWKLLVSADSGYVRLPVLPQELEPWMSHTRPLHGGLRFELTAFELAGAEGLRPFREKMAERHSNPITGRLRTSWREDRI
jgi:hypothetical protein